MSTPNHSKAEIWRPVPQFEGLYEASNLGNVRHIYPPTFLRYGRFLKPHQSKHGYLYISLWVKQTVHGRLVHRVIMETFLGTCPDKYVVHHRDGNKTNNELTNLEYVTMGYNNQHAIETGLRISARGEKIAASVLTDEKVRQIRDLLASGQVKQKIIAVDYNICESQISEIKHGRAWTHILS